MFYSKTLTALFLSARNLKKLWNIIRKNPNGFTRFCLAKNWFSAQNFTGFTFLLKGSRGMKIEKVLE